MSLKEDMAPQAGERITEKLWCSDTSVTMGKTERAVEDILNDPNLDDEARYLEIIQLEPNHTCALYELGRIAFEKQHYNMAADYLWKVASKKPTDIHPADRVVYANLIVLLWDVYFCLGKYRQAIDLYIASSQFSLEKTAQCYKQLSWEDKIIAQKVLATRWITEQDLQMYLAEMEKRETNAVSE